MDIEKGQKLVLQHKRRNGICEAEVVSVGHKWVTLNLGNPNYRFRIDDPQMTIDGRGYSSPGRCYLSREEFETHTRRSEAIGTLCGVCKDLSYFNVSNFITASTEEIEKVTEQLKRLFMRKQR